MQSNYSNFGMEQLKGTLIQAEQAIRSGRLSSLQSPAKNVQIFRVEPGDNARPSGKTPQPAGFGSQAAISGSQTDSEVYREVPDRTPPVTDTASAGTGNNTGVGRRSDTGMGTGAVATAPQSARIQAPGDYSGLLRFNFNEENLLSGIVMAEVLGKPKCLRRGRW